MSTQRRIYLDHNATTPLAEAARLAMVDAMADLGNPSSIHAEGRRVRDRIERARQQIAGFLRRPREEVVWTSGGTEANQLGVLALAAVAERAGRPRVVATTALEHPSLRGPIGELARRGWTVQTLAVEASGRLAAPAGPLGLAALALVNHELGTCVPPETIAALEGAGALVHLDAVQAAGKAAIPKAHAVALSAHKLGGPQGIGALAIALDEGLPVVAGGHQERGRRPGTENTLGIVGFAAAVQALEPATWPAIAALGEDLERGLRQISGVRIHGDHMPRVGGTINAGFAGALGESIVIALDLAGIAVSTGAACTSGTVEPSPVLLGLGLTADAAREAVRFSLGRTTTRAEIEQVLAVLPEVVARARAHRA
jgi:cysteine desulfurase